MILITTIVIAIKIKIFFNKDNSNINNLMEKLIKKIMQTKLVSKLFD